MQYLVRFLTSACGVLLIVGCSTSVETSPVSGTVMFEDQPLLAGEIVFISKETGYRATGQITKGSYRLTTLQTDDGAVLGEHQVVIRPLLSSSGSPLISIPDKYSKVETSGWTRTVNSGVNRFDFILKIEDDAIEEPR